MLRIFYNYIYIKKTVGEEKSEEMLQSYLDYYEENKHELSKDKLYEVLAYINEEVTDIPVKTFVAKTAEYVENVMLDKLEECIISREKETKILTFVFWTLCLGVVALLISFLTTGLGENGVNIATAVIQVGVFLTKFFLIS